MASDWVEFDGRVSSLSPEGIWLEGFDTRFRVLLDADDVEDAEVVRIRVGARVRSLVTPDGRLWHPQSRRVRSRGAGSTMCIDGSEISCDTGEVVGSCKGFWTCS